MRVRLIRKLADCLDGVDVKDREVGDVLDLAPADALVLVAEGWVTPEGDDHGRPAIMPEDELIGTS